MVTLINPPSKLHYLRALRSPALLGCDSCKYGLRGRTALSGVGRLASLRGTGLGDAGVPAGTVLAYTATWKDSALQLNCPTCVLPQIQSQLANQWGIIVDGMTQGQSNYFNFSGVQSMTLQVHINSDYGSPADIQSIIDGVIYGVTNKHVAQGMPSSTIRIVQSVPGAASPTAQLPQEQQATLAAAQAGFADAQARGDSVSASQFAAQIQTLTGTNPLGGAATATQWLSNNWMYLAGAGLGFILIKELL